jgi:hypothetical protein
MRSMQRIFMDTTDLSRGKSLGVCLTSDESDDHQGEAAGCDKIWRVNAVRRLLVAGVVVGASLVAMFSVAIRAIGGWGQIGVGWSNQSLYDHVAFALTLLLAVGGLLLADGGRGVRLIGAAVASVTGSALAGSGATAYRRWFTSGGFTAHAKNESDLRLMAIALTCTAGVAAITATTLLWAAHRPRIRPTVAALAGVVAGVVPFLMGETSGSTSTSVFAHMLMYGLPWALAVLIVGHADRGPAVAAGAVMIIHLVAVAMDDAPMIPMAHRHLGAGLATVLLVGAWLTRQPVVPTEEREARERAVAVGGPRAAT